MPSHQNQTMIRCGLTPSLATVFLPCFKFINKYLYFLIRCGLTQSLATASSFQAAFVRPSKLVRLSSRQQLANAGAFPSPSFDSTMTNKKIMTNTKTKTIKLLLTYQFNISFLLLHNGPGSFSMWRAVDQCQSKQIPQMHHCIIIGIIGIIGIINGIVIFIIGIVFAIRPSSHWQLASAGAFSSHSSISTVASGLF